MKNLLQFLFIVALFYSCNISQDKVSIYVNQHKAPIVVDTISSKSVITPYFSANQMSIDFIPFNDNIQYIETLVLTYGTQVDSISLKFKSLVNSPDVIFKDINFDNYCDVILET